MNREILSVIDQIGREKGIEPQRIVKAVESALLSAIRKRYGGDENIHVRLDSETGEIEAIVLKKIVESVANPGTEIALEAARQMDPSAELGDEIGDLLEVKDFGRIAAQTAKQVILQKVREAEWESVHREYALRQGELVSGVILGQERRNYIVQLGKSEAIMPYQEVPVRESYRRGDRLRAYLLEVKPSSDGPQIVLSRSHPHFVVRLFEMEVPEIGSGTVVIKGAVREAGDRTKIAVFSKESSVDPVGACVGVRGCRVQAVVRELKGEKIDIITWTEDVRTFIGEALSPAIIDKVGINEAERSALIVVSEQQLSLAIGKKGQNVRLASKLTGWKLDIINQEEYEKERAKERDQEISGAISQATLEQNRERNRQNVAALADPVTETPPEDGPEPDNQAVEADAVH